MAIVLGLPLLYMGYMIEEWHRNRESIFNKKPGLSRTLKTISGFIAIPAFFAVIFVDIAKTPDRP